MTCLLVGSGVVVFQAAAQLPVNFPTVRNGNDCLMPSNPDEVVGQLEGDQPAVFPGGVDSSSVFFARLTKSLDTTGCPDHAWVSTQFVVGKDGAISDVIVVNSACPKIDGAVIEMVRTMPRWKPGTCKGVPLNMRVNFPVRVRG